MYELPLRVYGLFTPECYQEMEGELDTPCKVASYLMRECNYRLKLVYISCSRFSCSPFWEERESVEVCSTLSDFLSDTRKVVFSSDDAVTENFNADENCSFIEGISTMCLYPMEMILYSGNPKLESVLTDNRCSAWMACSIICSVCQFLGVEEGPHYTMTSTPEENLIKDLLYKHLKTISFSVDVSEPSHHLYSYGTIGAMTSAVETQTSLETVQLNGWLFNEHLGMSDSCFEKQNLTDLFSVLVSLFKQLQFQSLELKVTSFFFSTLQELLHTFFRALSPNHQSLKLESVSIIQEKDEISMLSSCQIPMRRSSRSHCT